MLVRLLYASTLAAPNEGAAVESILMQSRARNAALGITGVLVYSDGIFLQALEGGRNQVSQLYSRICGDTRHTAIVLLQFEEINERRFGGWTMGQVDLAKVNNSVLLKYSEAAVLNPYAVNGAVSLALLEELVLSAAVMGRS